MISSNINRHQPTSTDNGQFSHFLWCHLVRVTHRHYSLPAKLLGNRETNKRLDIVAIVLDSYFRFGARNIIFILSHRVIVGIFILIFCFLCFCWPSKSVWIGRLMAHARTLVLWIDWRCVYRLFVGRTTSFNRCVPHNIYNIYISLSPSNPRHLIVSKCWRRHWWTQKNQNQEILRSNYDDPLFRENNSDYR